MRLTVAVASLLLLLIANARAFVLDADRDESTLGAQLLRRLSASFNGKRQQEDALLVDARRDSIDWAQLERAVFVDSRPVIFAGLTSGRRRLVERRLRLPIQHDSTLNDRGSEILMVDTFEDEHNGVHYRLIHLPAGGDDALAAMRGWSDDEYHMKLERNWTRTDARALVGHGGLDSPAGQALMRDIEDYLRFCGGASRRRDAQELKWRRAVCLGYLRDEFPQYRLSASQGDQWLASTMTPPDSGAVRAYLLFKE